MEVVPGLESTLRAKFEHVLSSHGWIDSRQAPTISTTPAPPAPEVAPFRGGDVVAPARPNRKSAALLVWLVAIALLGFAGFMFWNQQEEVEEVEEETLPNEDEDEEQKKGSEEEAQTMDERPPNDDFSPSNMPHLQSFFFENQFL